MDVEATEEASVAEINGVTEVNGVAEVNEVTEVAEVTHVHADVIGPRLVSCGSVLLMHALALRSHNPFNFWISRDNSGRTRDSGRKA